MIYGHTVAAWTAQVVVAVLTAGHVVAVVELAGQAVGLSGQVVGNGMLGHTVVLVWHCVAMDEQLVGVGLAGSGQMVAS